MWSNAAQVISKICQVCAKVAQGVHMSKADAAALITGMHGKLSDTKVQPHAFEMLSSLSEVRISGFELPTGALRNMQYGSSPCGDALAAREFSGASGTLHLTVPSCPRLSIATVAVSSITSCSGRAGGHTSHSHECAASACVQAQEPAGVGCRHWLDGHRSCRLWGRCPRQEGCHRLLQRDAHEHQCWRARGGDRVCRHPAQLGASTCLH